MPRGGALTVTATARGAHSGLDLAWAAAGGAAVTSPAHTAAAATPGAGFSRTSIATLACTSDPNLPGWRALTATLPALTALEATVTCTAAGHAAASQTVTLSARGRCASPLGTLTHGRTTTAGTVAADAVCRSEQRVASAGHGGHYARRHTFTLAGPATVTVSVDAAPAGGFDPYLLLLGGTRTTGAVLARNDDRTPSDNDPRIGPVRLAAGTYTAEATTSVAGAAGSYTLAVDVAYDPIVLTGLHGATATGTGAVAAADAFTVAPAAAVCTAVPAAATVTGTGSARTLTASINAPGTLEVTVACTAAGRAGTARTVTLTAALPCSGHLGGLATGRVALSGAIARDAACTSALHQGDPRSAGTYYARRHTFTLAEPAWIDIDLAAAGSALNPYVVLLAGHGSAGTALAQDNDSGAGNAAQIKGRYLDAGGYTIEATANTATGSTATGDYTLTVTVPIHGLPQTINATVDEQTTVNFTYWPTTAVVAVASRDIAVLSSGSGGRSRMLVSPERARSHAVAVRLSTSAVAGSGPAGAARGASERSAQPTTVHRTVNVTVDGECPVGTVLSPVNGVLCVKRSSSSDPRLDHIDDKPVYSTTAGAYEYYEGPYEVTVGALIGARDAAQAAINARRGMPCSSGRSMGVHELAALMLAIGFWENPISQYMKNIRGVRESAVMRFPARSLMTLSRKDHEWTFLGTERVAAGEDNSRLYSFNSLTREPHRAFWHAGVGMWQLDTLGEAVKLNHGQRADTRFGGKEIARVLHKESCSKSPSSFETWLEAKWRGCKPKDNPESTESQCLRSKRGIWMNSGTRDDLFATVRNSSRHLSPTGGAELFRCRWLKNGVVEAIDGGHGDLGGHCYFYDTKFPEGMVSNGQPHDGHRTQQFNSDGEDVSSSPYAAPFISFTDDGQKFAVFPASLLPDFAETLIKVVPDNTTVRLHSSASWHRRGFDGKELQLRLCRPIALFEPYRCAWVSVNAGASTPGGSFESWIAAARG